MGFCEEGRYLFIGKAGYATADSCDEESKLWMLLGEGDEFIDVWLDSLHATLHRWNTITLSLQTHALTPDGTKLSVGKISRATTMCPSEIAAKHKNLILFQMRNPLGCYSFLFHSI